MQKTIRLQFLLMAFIFLSPLYTLQAQFVARMEIKSPIEGVCNLNEVYALFPMLEGHEEAVCPIPEAYLLKRLNNEVDFLKEHKNYNDQGMIKMIINCQGLVVKCIMDDPTENEVLDRQIEEVFNTLGEWKSGRFLGRNVDSARLFTFRIVNGVFTFNLN